MYCTGCLYGAGRNDFDAGNIHYKGHWKGWALKIDTFSGATYLQINKPFINGLNINVQKINSSLHQQKAKIG